jgi:hypothetical protein
VSVLRCRRASGPPSSMPTASSAPMARGLATRTPARCAAPKGCENFGLGPGRSAWRALYRQVGEVFLVAAVGPEAQADPRGFDRTARRALDRLAKVEES